MMGLLYILFFAFYLLVSISAVIIAYRYTKERYQRGWVGGWLAAFVMYNLVFWDWIPTVVMHQYYCATKAGFVAYKTLEQWKKDNPGVVETLVANEGAPSTSQGDMNNHTDTYFLNRRISWVINKTGPLLFHRWRWEESIVDSGTSQILVKFVDFSTGNGHIGGEPELQFWLHSDGCSGGNAANHAQVYEYRKQLSGRAK